MAKWKFTLYEQDFGSFPVGKVWVNSQGLPGEVNLVRWGMSTLIELSFAGLNLQAV